jgi:hypothetical protein
MTLGTVAEAPRNPECGPVQTSGWDLMKTLFTMAVLILVLFATAPAANACTCVRDTSESAQIAAADVAFVGRLLEIRRVPIVHNATRSMWDGLWKDGWNGLVTAWVMQSMQPSERTEYVFESLETLKGQTSPRVSVTDATTYTSSCAVSKPNFSHDVGKKLRVLAYRRPGSETPVVYFSLCSYSFKPVADERVSVATQFGSQVLPPSPENACSKWQVSALLQEMTKRTKIARPFSVS